MQQGFTCGCSLGKEGEGSSWPAEVELGCRAEGAAQEGTSHSRKSMEVEDLSSRNRRKQRCNRSTGCSNN